jgi:hypothetical protein
MKQLIPGCGLCILLVLALAAAGCSTLMSSAKAGNFGSRDTQTVSISDYPAAAATSSDSGSSASDTTPISAAGSHSLFSYLHCNRIDWKMKTEYHGPGSSGSTTTYTHLVHDTEKCTTEVEVFENSKRIDAVSGHFDCGNEGTVTGVYLGALDPRLQVNNVQCSATEEPLTTPAGTFSVKECLYTEPATPSTSPRVKTFWILGDEFVIKEHFKEDLVETDTEIMGYG